MTERELLELAARAVGVKGCFIEEHPEDGAPCYRCGIGKVGAITTMWNPLKSDADVFRLMVDLDLCTGTDGDEIAVGREDIGLVVISAETDKHAATRRAIVMAASEIGKEL